MNPKLGLEQFGSAHVFCMTKFLAQTMISKVSKPNIQIPIEIDLQGWIGLKTNKFQVLSSIEVRPICPAVLTVQLSTDFGTSGNCLAKLST